MESTGRIVYLTVNDVIEINDLMIREFGGINVKNSKHQSDCLSYIMEFVMDDNIFPDIYHKAAFYAEKLITKHCFTDGNKRTGVFCALYFLRLNGYVEDMEFVNNERLIGIAHGIINRETTFNDLVEWFRNAVYK